MCGIAGILGQVDDGNRVALRRMSAALAHRGPDGEGVWVSEPDAHGEGCLLAHRRLSILDLSTAADQPMVDPHGGQVIVFNGEIYNYRTLRDDLAAAGESFTSSGDTAVMLRALAVRGSEAVQGLRGMFAFALWDPAKRELMLGRDPLGIKPLYVCRNPEPGRDRRSRGWSLVFASELRAILASGLLGRPRLDPSAVASVVWNGFVAGPGTAVQGVASVEPGEVRTYTGAGAETASKVYWSMPGATRARDGGAGTVGEALRESVREHLISDVPVGVFLSSGVDSSAVANLAQRCSDRPVNTFTLAFEEASLSEGASARRIAAAIGTEHREVVLSEERFVSLLDAALDSLDQPTFDGLNSYYISMAIREAGLKVALVGTGGDELFGGYKSFRELPMLARWAQRSGWMPSGAKSAGARLAARVLAGSSGGVGPQTRWAKLPDMVEAGADTLRLYQLAYALFLPGFQRELLNGTASGANLIHGLPPALHARLTAEAAGHSVLSQVSVLEQRCFLGERLLRDTDAASMAVSIETRLPLVDSVLVEAVNRLPDAARYEPVGRKQMLRTAGLEGLDPALFERPKRGFVLPYDAWIRQGLGASMDEVMRDGRAAAAVGLEGASVTRLWDAYLDGAPGMYWSRVWALYVLIRWCHRHGVLV